MEVEVHSFLTSALTGDQCLASRPGRFIPAVSTLELGGTELV